MSNSSHGLGGRSWLALVLFGLFGQIAWTIENMYFNVFLYKTVTYDPNAVFVMVAASAAVATLTTLLMGVLSDKLGRRKPFIAWGYVVWGLSIMVFALISRENTARLFPGADAVALTVAIVVVMDCVMTFFGSTANDAAFNAWVTDITVPETRGRAEGVLSALPLLAIMILFGGLDFLAKQDNWALLYILIGGTVSLCGLLGLFLIRDNPNLAVQKTDLLYGFRPKVIRANPLLYLFLVLMGIFSISMQVFFPYLMIYLEFSLALENYAILLGIVLVFAAAISVLGGRMADKFGKRKFFFPSGIALVIGLVLMYIHGTYLKENLFLLAVFAILMMGSNLLLTALFGASIRDYMPEAQRGHFNGIRMIFFVLIPMVAGPFIGARIIKSGPTFLDEFGAAQIIPNPGIFLGAAIVALAMFIPMAIIYKKSKEDKPA
ncbi:MAG: MFS transporter [Oscillospiraceae bacterium]|nr:MFS transporter [Oscillospiraceae bacterium]